MKIKKTVTAAFLCCFVALTVLCLVLGPKIRDALSLKIDFIYPESVISDGYLCCSLPTGAIRYDIDGSSYVMLAEISENYPERCYEAKKREVTVYSSEGGTALVLSGIMIGDRVILTEPVADGQRVVLKG